MVVLGLAACAERGEIAFGPTAADAVIQQVWVAKFRPDHGPAEGQRSPPRPQELVYERYSVSIPATHEIGHIEWPKTVPNAATDFVTVAQDAVQTLDRFSTQVAAADIGSTGTTVLFVHGYNYTHGEAVYQTAQIAHDFETPSPMVLFSWPSAGVSGGYLYDRDSVLIARDELEKVIIGLTRNNGRQIDIIAHSMGNQLVMETLRQIEISGSLNIGKKINALVMISPDIDGELFYTQAARIKELPRETVILAARQDRALRLSALLTGRTNRLGSETDRRAVRDLPIAVVDTSDLSLGGTSHSIPFSSPTAISILKNLDGDITLQGRAADEVVNLADLK